MSFLLTDPAAVLVVGGSDAAVDSVRSTLTAGPATDVVAADDVIDATDVLTERDDVGCVLLLGAEDGSNVESYRRVRETDEAVPVIVHRPESACDLAALAGERGCEYLPRSASDESLGEAVGDAIADFDEQRRRDAESSLFTTLLSEGIVPLFVKDEQGRHLYKADVEDHDDPETVVGETDVDLAEGTFREPAERSYRDDLEVIETGEAIREKEERYERADYEFWIETTKVPWRGDDGEVQGLLGTSQDVSERKSLENWVADQEERIDQFVSYVAHDLRTPLQIAYGALERARRGDDSALDDLEAAIERVDDMVDDLGELSTGDGAAAPGDALETMLSDSPTTELSHLVEDVWSVIAPEAATLEVEVPRETTVGVRPGTIRPLVENLLKNAIDHAGPDVTVWVGVTGSRAIYVEDDGPGIPPAERSKVTRQGYTTAEDGTGTGLKIVEDTVIQQDWTLEIVDGRAGGARFEIGGFPIVSKFRGEATPGEPIALDENRDVGPVSISGCAEYDGAADRWTVVANGEDAWGDTHEFHYVHGSGDAPIRIEGRVERLQGVHEYSKAGLAVRAGLDPTDRFGFVGSTQSHGSEVIWREREDGYTVSDQFEEQPGTFPWYRAEFVDGVVTCYASKDGDQWVPLGQRAMDLGETVSVGLLVCSHSEDETCEATFRDVRAYELDVE